MVTVSDVSVVFSTPSIGLRICAAAVWYARRAVSNFLRTAQGQIFSSFSVVSATRYFRRPRRTPHFVWPCLAMSVMYPQRERMLWVSQSRSDRRVSRLTTFQVELFTTRDGFGVRFKTHNRFGSQSARGWCLPTACLDKARADAHCPAG